MNATGVGRAIADGVLHTARLFAPARKAPVVDVAGRTFVVTGATPGSLGYVVADKLACWGGDVVATCLRDPARLERSLTDGMSGVAGGGRVTASRLDLADRASVEAFARSTEERLEGRLHVLINNAGILKGMFAGRREPEYAPDGREVHWRTNYLGAFHLTRLLFPMLERAARESGDARLVNVASHQHVRARNEQLFDPAACRDSWDAYGLSKLAMVHMCAELHRRHGAAGDFRAVALHPGTVYTNMIAEGLASDPRLRVLRPVLQRLTRSLLLTPAAGAQTVLWCATAASVQGGRYYERCAPAPPSAEVLDQEAGARLWEASARWADS
ncbi:MAG: SDR family NAD(P)-dependent oxidoreductase [Gammaproteobacteria bacterium]|nr:SDR family NAD(P)-dependent oxidoreductase [Gammaproteobacteria bacterium]